MSNFAIKQGDTSPKLVAQLKDGDGEPINLVDTQVIEFHMMNADTDEVVIEDSSASVDDGENGVVSYDWKSGDTENEGHFKAEFEVVWNSGKIESFPNQGYIDVYIDRDIS